MNIESNQAKQTHTPLHTHTHTPTHIKKGQTKQMSMYRNSDITLNNKVKTIIIAAETYLLANTDNRTYIKQNYDSQEA